MKTSTKIILLFVSLLLAGMLTLYITTKYRHRSEPPKVEWKNKILEPFSVVVAFEKTNCNISGYDNNVISWIAQKEGSPKMFVRNDTLYVHSSMNFKNGSEQVIIHCKTLRSIIANKVCKLLLSDINSGPLKVFVNGGNVTIDNSNFNSEKPYDRTIDLTVEAENLAYVYLSNVKVGKWIISLNKAKIIANEGVQSQDMKLVLKDRSYAEFKTGPKNITLDRDSTSKVVIN